MISPRCLLQWFVVLWLGLSFSAAVARAGDNSWGPLVAELRGIRTELTELRRAVRALKR